VTAVTFVANSTLVRTDFTEGYWSRLYAWYESGGLQHVAAYLHQVDLSDFDPKAPPPQTEAFLAVVNANRAPENDDFADALDQMGEPEVVTINQLANHASEELSAWMKEHKNRRSVPRRMNDCGYVQVTNPDRSDGRWRVSGVPQTVYAKREVGERDRVMAVRRLCGTL
jgi:hypothetical protein